MKQNIFFMLLSISLFSNLELFAQKWLIGGNTLTADSRLGSNNAFDVIFETNNIERGRITPSGLWGIGTTVPNVKLHIDGGTPAGLSSGGYIVTGSMTGYNLAIDENGLNARKNGSYATLYLNSSQTYINNDEGNVLMGANAGSKTKVGIGSNDPGNFKLKVSHQTYGLNIENAGTLDDWELVTLPDLLLYFNGSFKGTFDRVTGAYTSTSDERLKTNIKPMGVVLDKINQLKPSTYQFKNAKATNVYNGFIAQDVMKVFPSLVTHNVAKERNLDVFTLDYSGFGVIAIKGIQELQTIVQEQKTEVTTLKERISKLEAVIVKLTANNNFKNNFEVNASFLQQNIPNPFNHTTTINYTLPPAYSSAKIIVTDKSGKILKETNVSAKGKGNLQLDVSNLSSGAYQYSLYVDGKLMDTKQMMLIK